MCVDLSHQYRKLELGICVICSCNALSGGAQSDAKGQLSHCVFVYVCLGVTMELGGFHPCVCVGVVGVVHRNDSGLRPHGATCFLS